MLKLEGVVTSVVMTSVYRGDDKQGATRWNMGTHVLASLKFDMLPIEAYQQCTSKRTLGIINGLARNPTKPLLGRPALVLPYDPTAPIINFNEHSIGTVTLGKNVDQTQYHLGGEGRLTMSLDEYERFFEGRHRIRVNVGGVFDPKTQDLLRITHLGLNVA